jgi:SpoVK/Ycf46/Vps4 family AAA+-type ATPase
LIGRAKSPGEPIRLQWRLSRLRSQACRRACNDEIEKGFSGTKSSKSTDGGTSNRVFGSFISRMQEKNAPVFIIATANDVSQLPPEMLKKRRLCRVERGDPLELDETKVFAS